MRMLLLLVVLTLHPAPGPQRDILFTSSPDGRNDQVWRMHADGSEPRALTPATEGIQERFATWSPDGTTIAFLSNRHDPGRARPAIFLMTADGTSAWRVGPESIPHQGAPDFSPDGTRIVFAGGGMDARPLTTDLYVMDLQGSNLRRLTNFDAFISCPRWSPDGELILFSKDMDELLLVEVATGRVLKALPAGVEGTCGDWSPDGFRLAFSSGPDRQVPSFHEVLANPSFPREVFVLDLVRGDLTHMPQAGPHATYPRWSPEGQHIVFQAHIPPGGAWEAGFMPSPGVSEVYVMKADGSEVRRLTYNSQLDGQPSW